MVKKTAKAKSVPAPATPRPAPPPAAPQWVESGSGHQHVWERAGVLKEGEVTEFCTICAATRPA